VTFKRGRESLEGEIEDAATLDDDRADGDRATEVEQDTETA
jgi:hypothetical protein